MLNSILVKKDYGRNKEKMIDMKDYCDFYKLDNYSLPVENSLYIIKEIEEINANSL